jgi:flagellar basal body P-ring protein FlgI
VQRDRPPLVRAFGLLMTALSAHAVAANLDEIVRAVNQVGAAPGDLVAILEALKEAGALRAELIVI